MDDGDDRDDSDDRDDGDDGKDGDDDKLLLIGGERYNNLAMLPHLRASSTKAQRNHLCSLTGPVPINFGKNCLKRRLMSHDLGLMTYTRQRPNWLLYADESTSKTYKYIGLVL